MKQTFPTVQKSPV